MEEVSFAGEDHREPELVGLLDDGFVAHRAARLDDRGDAGRRRRLDAVFEGIERVARARAAAGASGCLLRRDFSRLDPVLLAGTDADGLPVFDEDDRVRLHMTADAP